MPKSSPWYIKPLIVLGLVVAGAGALAVSHTIGRAEPKPQVTEAGRPVLVATVHFAPEQASRSLVATIRPRIEADQSFRVTGKAARRLVDVGQTVKAGDPLARLDETDLRLQKEQAEAERAASRMSLEQATADEKRGAELRTKGWTSQAVYDRQRTALEEARGRNRRAERAVELATNALDYAILRADADGVVTAALVEPGQVMAAGQPAIRIARTNEKEAAVALPEAFVESARRGEAKLSLWAAPGHEYQAKLRELSPTADPATRTFAARFSLPDADTKVSLGMSATLTIAAPPAAQVARLPLSALFEQGGGPALWTVAPDGALVLKSVTVARYDGANVLVSQGVAEGDRVVVLGVQKLDAGQKVRTITQLAF